MVRQDLLRRRGDVRYRLIDGEAVVLRQEAAETLVLNEVGARILDLLDGQTPVTAVVDRLEEEYEAERTELESDCLEFVDDLVHRGVLEVVPGEGP